MGKELFRKVEIVAVMDGVREYAEGYPVELCRDGKGGRLVIRAYNEATHDETRVDLWDLIDWLRSGSAAAKMSEGMTIDFSLGHDRSGRETGAG